MGKGFAGLTAQELKVIAQRTNGVKTPEIAKRMGITRELA
jgi:transcriptional regulator